jgi:sulfur dioxygenase
MFFRQLFDRSSCTYTYLLADDAGSAVLIDPVVELLDRDLSLLHELGLRLDATLETHIHADHITSAAALRDRTGCRIATCSEDYTGQDVLLNHGDVLHVGTLALEARHTPGHTAGSACFWIDDRVFTGDTLLIRGCGRTDFQGGSAEQLYRSVHEQLFTLPDTCRVYPGHDYQGRTVSTIGEEKAHNPRLGGGRTESEFVTIMRNLKLDPPTLIDVAVPANRTFGPPAILL